MIQRKCYITPPIRFKFGFWLARLANRILPLKVILKLDITQEDIDRAFEEYVEGWDL